MENKHVYTAINNVQAELSKEGISKGRKNAQQGYAFRGIDDVYGAISPLLAKEGLVLLPHYTERTVVERTTTKGGLLFYVTVKGTFEIVDAKDGSVTTCETYGEAMDSADKATNKAMSAAYKYVCLQTFCIPTEGDNDADATTYDVKPMTPVKKPETVKHRITGINDEIPFAEPDYVPADLDQWMTVNAFAGEMQRCNDIREISKLLTGQKGNPRLQELIPLATARKQEIMNDLQLQ